jgi:hypothetical protein
MGASGLLETCIMLDDLDRGIIRAIKNRTKYDDVFLSDTRVVDGSVNILSLAAGMGNVYSAAIFRTL